MDGSVLVAKASTTVEPYAVIPQVWVYVGIAPSNVRSYRERLGWLQNVTEDAGMKDYDSSWDEGDEDAWDEKFDEWSKRDWEVWLLGNLSFPFEVERVEDDREFIPQENNEEPFTVGHVFKVEGVEMEDEMYGFIAKVREGRRIGYVPLCDVEITSKTERNYWPVREYVVWFANR